MRRWFIPAATVASLFTALVLSAPSQDRQAESKPTGHFHLEYVKPQDFNSHTLLLSENLLQAAAKDLEMAEDLEILGEVLRARVAALYADSTFISKTLTTHRHVNKPFRPFAAHYAIAGQGLQRVWVDLGHLQSDPAEVKAERDQLLVANDQAARQPMWFLTVSHGGKVERPQSAYLEGYGVVYHVQLDVPPPEEERSGVPAGKADRTPVVGGPWENAKRALRGQPPEPLGFEVDRRVPTKDDLVNRLLDVLAENAGNFRHLKGEDRLAVAITFPRKEAPATAAADGTKRIRFQLPTAPTDDATFQYYPGLDGRTTPADEAVAKGMTWLARVQDTRSSHEVSGDLHMRQQNYQKAVEAYEKALGAVYQPYASAGGKPADAVRRKLIQAYTALGNLEKARSLIDKALASERKGQGDEAPAKPPHAIPLPAKLVVSVRKSQLDEVAAGKMKREELNKHATVRYFKPPPGTPGLGVRRRQPPSDDPPSKGDPTDYRPPNPMR